MKILIQLGNQLIAEAIHEFLASDGSYEAVSAGESSAKRVHSGHYPDGCRDGEPIAALPA